MAETGQIPTMVEKEIGAGGPGFVAESDCLQIELDDVALIRIFRIFHSKRVGLNPHD